MKNLRNLFSASFLALTLITTAGCASSPKEEGTGEYVDDAVITQKINAQLLNEPDMKSFEINVETFKGVVQLSGFVNTHANIDKAVEIARATHGVKSVKNNMRLR